MKDILLAVLATLTGTGVIAAVVTWILGKWIGARIDASVKAEYDRLQVDYEDELRRKERAQLVAELLAEWMSMPFDPPWTPEQRKRINKLSFEATLWLPETIAIELSQVMQHDPSAPNQFDVLLRVRRLLNGTHNLTAKHVTQWSREWELPNKGLPDGCVDGQIVVLKVEFESDGVLTLAEMNAENQTITIPKGATLHLSVVNDGETVQATTADIQALRCLQVDEGDGADKKFTLSVFPKDIANQINRMVRAPRATASDVTEGQTLVQDPERT